MSGAGRRNRDLRLVAAAALVSLLLVALPFDDGALEALLLFPAVLALPGYALVAAMFPAPTLSRGERLIYSFAASVGATALGGLAWQIFFELTPFAWASIFTAVTLAACELARRRRANLEAPKRGRLARLDAPTAIAALLAVALAVVAVRTASAGEQEQRAESHFSALWIVPHGASGDVEVGLVNHQGAVYAYRLIVTADGRRLRDRNRRLGSRARIGLLLDATEIPPDARLVATLYRDGAVYRRVALQAGAGA